ncbi:uncharacterized protein [Battus philenor]|uniref:uncharacterized protein n=1 Tax=Battus philenor TaxID=42288 RepID=UPI0035CFB976
MLFDSRKVFLKFLLFVVAFLLLQVQCCPTGSENVMFSKLDPRTENRFSNGTVIGNYKYVDKEGNPVLVKYYADDAGYGSVEFKYVFYPILNTTIYSLFMFYVSLSVELKSMKVLDGTNEPAISHSDKPQKVDNLYPSLISSDFLTDYQNTISSPINSTRNKLRQISDLNKAVNKGSYSKSSHKTSPDYEIYLQNEIVAPKCGKGKVRIYVDKGKRKIREVLNDVATFKYFDQFD